MPVEVVGVKDVLKGLSFIDMDMRRRVVAAVDPLMRGVASKAKGFVPGNTDVLSGWSKANAGVERMRGRNRFGGWLANLDGNGFKLQPRTGLPGHFATTWRQVRGIPTRMEKRSINYEFRAMPESRTIVGTATVFNSAYDMGWYDEEMSQDVFTNSDMSDVVALFNHDANMVLARTKSGTLKLKVTGNAMEYEFEAPNTTLGNDLLEMVKRGDVYQSSFAFSVEAEDWQEREGMKPKRLIRGIKKVYDVSPVTYPANPDTMVAKRSYEQIAGKVDEELQSVIDISVKSEINIQNELRRNALHLLNLKTK